MPPRCVHTTLRRSLALLLIPVVLPVYFEPIARADNFWQSLGGPQGGSVYAIARDSSSNNLYLATGYQHGYNKNAGSVFKSTDNGDHWTYVSADFFSLANPINTRVRGLAVNAAGQVFAALEGAGVWRSVNAGASWSALNAGLSDLQIRDVAVAPTGETYAATATQGVFQLNGPSWTAFNTNLTSLDTRCFAFASGYMLVGTATGGVFKRPSAGTWAASSNGLTDLRINSLHVSSNGLRLLACTNTGLFESTDNAASWHPKPGPFTGTLIWSALDLNPGLLIGTAAGLFSSDGSETQWSAVTNGFTGTACRVLLNDGLGRIFAGSFEEGVFRSTDAAQSWSQASAGIYGRTVTRLIVSGAGTILAGTALNGVFRSDVLGAPWSGPVLARQNMFALAQSPWGDLFAGNYNILPGGIPDGHAWRSLDEGANWVPLDNGPAVAMVSGFAFPGPAQQVTCSTAWGPSSIRTSATNGDQWSLLAPPPGNEAFCLTRNPQGDLFTGSEGHGVLRFNAASQTWTNLGLATLSQQFSIAINSQGHVFVGNDGNIKGVYKSTANGDGLSPLNTFPSNYGYAILCLPNDDLYVGTLDKGIQYSHDGGASWTTVNSGIPVTSCQTLTLGPDGHLYAGVAGFGVYRSALPVTSVLAGDVDGDGDVDAADIALFSGVLLGVEAMPIRVLRSDLNADGLANGADIAGMTAAYLGP